MIGRDPDFLPPSGDALVGTPRHHTASSLNLRASFRQTILGGCPSVGNAFPGYPPLTGGSATRILYIF
jgi:hypothetical protein